MNDMINWDIDNNVPEDTDPAVVPVVGEGLKNGFNPSDVPDGFITWNEHYEAWFVYHDAYPRGDTAEQLANGGGFTFNELKQWLGHTPRTWVPREKRKYQSYYDNVYNAPEPEEPPADEPFVDETKISHIWYGDGVSICISEKDEPSTPFNFDIVEGPACQLCLDKVLGWMRKWNGTEEEANAEWVVDHG